MKKVLNSFLVTAGFVAAASFPCLGSAQEAPPSSPPPPAIVLDRVVAVVNDGAITKRQLDEAIKNVSDQLERQHTALPPADVLQKQVLERLIYNRIQLQEAKEADVVVDDAAVEKAITNIADGNNITIAQMQAALKKEGLDFAKFREQIRDEITIAKLRARDVDDKIFISDNEVDNFLKIQKGKGNNDEEFDLSHILIRLPEQPTAEQVQSSLARAQAALAQLKSGVDFRQVAASFSESPDAVQGGEIGWRGSDQLPQIFAEAVASLKPGETTDILRSPNGFHILRVNNVRGQNTPVIIQQTHVRHILIKTNEIVSEEEAKDRLLKIKERIDQGANFAELARLQSEDIASATQGGDLGWLSPGDTVPEFEKAMNALKPGEISGPVRTQFGWHLIQVLGRRNADMTKQAQRARARNALRNQKADEAYQNWLRELHDRAYIEYHLDDK